MYIGFFSDTIPANNVTDYLIRVVQAEARFASTGCRPPRCSARGSSRCAPGWTRRSMAAHGVTADDVYTALGRQQLPGRGRQHQGPDGHGRPDRRHRPALASTSSGSWWSSSRATRWCASRTSPTSMLGAENYDFNVAFSGKRSVFIGIKVAPQGQHARRRQARARGACRTSSRSCRRGVTGEDRLRRHRVHQQLHPRGDQDAGRGADHRHAS